MGKEEIGDEAAACEAGWCNGSAVVGRDAKQCAHLDQIGCKVLPADVMRKVEKCRLTGCRTLQRQRRMGSFSGWSCQLMSSVMAETRQQKLVHEWLSMCMIFIFPFRKFTFITHT